MAVFLIGALGNTVSINLLLTELFKAEDVGRERAFYWYYIAMNLGYLVGYTMGGWMLNILSQPNLLFLLLFITQFMSAGVLVISYRDRLFQHVSLFFNYESLKLITIWSGVSVLLFLAIWFALQHAAITHSIVVLIAFVIVSYLFWNAKRLAAGHQYLTFAIYYLVNMTFWSVYFLAPLALLVFINHFVDLSIAGFHVPPQWIQNINPGVILLSALFSPILYRLKLRGGAFSLPIYFSTALSLMGLGFLVLFIGSYVSGGEVNVIWIIFSYILQSLGELCIGPIGFALVGRLIPVKHHGIYSGAWILTLGIGGALSSLMSGKIMSGHTGLEQSNFQTAFLAIAIFCMAIGLLLWGFRHILQKYDCASEIVK